MAKVSYKKLQPQKAGSFQIIKVEPHTVVLDVEEVLNMVLIHRFTAAPVLKEHSATAQEPSSYKNNNLMTQDKQNEKTSERDSQVSTSPSEYTADHIIDCNDRGRNMNYIVK